MLTEGIIAFGFCRHKTGVIALDKLVRFTYTVWSVRRQSRRTSSSRVIRSASLTTWQSNLAASTQRFCTNSTLETFWGYSLQVCQHLFCSSFAINLAFPFGLACEFDRALAPVLALAFFWLLLVRVLILGTSVWLVCVLMSLLGCMCAWWQSLINDYISYWIHAILQQYWQE